MAEILLDVSIKVPLYEVCANLNGWNNIILCIFIEIYRSVAQSGSALHWGCRGRRFKSYRSDHFSEILIPHL